MGVKVTNNAFGTLSAGISSSDTTVTLDSGQGARFPTLGAGDYFYGTLVDTSNNLEIVKVTARSSDSMTVTRAQDNTTAQAFSIGDRFELRPVAALFEAIQDEASVDGITSASTSGTAIDIDSSNNVGFGINSPDGLVHVYNGMLQVGSKDGDTSIQQNTNAIRIAAVPNSSTEWGGLQWYREYSDYIGAEIIATRPSTNEAQTELIFKTTGTNANATERMRITNDGIIKPQYGEFLGFEDDINILNQDPENGGTDFDQTPSNNADGGGTAWSISGDGNAIYFSSTSGGHGGTWMDVYCEEGLWAIKGSVRLTNTDGAIHGSTSTSVYKYTHSFAFSISGGPSTGALRFDADAAAAANGTAFTRIAFSSAPTYMSGGYKSIAFATSGYDGIQQIYITDLRLVRVG